MKREPISVEHDGRICELLFNKIGTPKNLISCRAINVYDNKYRINVYTKAIINDIDSQRISYSCFAKYDGGNNLLILDSTPSGVAL
jgi:hypothetical protein